MNRLVRTAGLLATVALVGYAALLLVSDDEADEAVEDAIADAQAGEDEGDEVEQRRERLQAVARGVARAPRPGHDDLPVEASVPAPAIEYGSGELKLEDVRTSFDYAMDRVDAVAKTRKRITKEDWDKLYREANDAYAALSIVLDASDETQRAELETAHVRLKQSLRRVRVRGRKFGT